MNQQIVSFSGYKVEEARKTLKASLSELNSRKGLWSGKLEFAEKQDKLGSGFDIHLDDIKLLSVRFDTPEKGTHKWIVGIDREILIKRWNANGKDEVQAFQTAVTKALSQNGEGYQVKYVKEIDYETRTVLTRQDRMSALAQDRKNADLMELGRKIGEMKKGRRNAIPTSSSELNKNRAAG